MQPLRIVILLHEADDFYQKTRYLLRTIVDIWTAQGHAVELVGGPDRFVPADVVIPHLDLTVTPERYRALLDRYPVVVNRHLLDIAKSRISAQLVNRRDPWRGPVIVKTDRNYGGKPEARLGSPPSVAPQPTRSLLRRAHSCVQVEPPPPQLRGLLREHGVDYGKIGYVLHDGEIVLFDVNRTPGSGAPIDRQLSEVFAQRLAAGLEGFIHGAAAAGAVRR